jgi:geranylgeranyl diphosphate synthase type II
LRLRQQRVARRPGLKKNMLALPRRRVRIYPVVLREVQPAPRGRRRVTIMAIPITQPQTAGVGGEFRDWLESSRRTVDDALAAHFRALQIDPAPHSRLADAVLYSVSLGGKRLRPILVLETARVCGGQAERALPAALAVECVHTFSLIHDDLPAMDNDDLRRGQPTNHKVFGEALAILAGDWLLAHAAELLAREPALLAALLEGTKQMIAGQAADIENQERPSDPELVRFIHRTKTAALIETCCRLGALCAAAPNDQVAALHGYGRHLGLAFQIIDDLLDATGSAEKLGKGTRKDAAAAKQTYPAAFGLAESRRYAQRELEAALNMLNSFDRRADRLRDLAHYVISRDR